MSESYDRERQESTDPLAGLAGVSLPEDLTSPTSIAASAAETPSGAVAHRELSPLADAAGLAAETSNEWGAEHHAGRDDDVHQVANARQRRPSLSAHEVASTARSLVKAAERAEASALARPARPGTAGRTRQQAPSRSGGYSTPAAASAVRALQPAMMFVDMALNQQMADVAAEEEAAAAAADSAGGGEVDLADLESKRIPDAAWTDPHDHDQQLGDEDANVESPSTRPFARRVPTRDNSDHVDLHEAEKLISELGDSPGALVAPPPPFSSSSSVAGAATRRVVSGSAAAGDIRFGSQPRSALRVRSGADLRAAAIAADGFANSNEDGRTQHLAAHTVDTLGVRTRSGVGPALGAVASASSSYGGGDGRGAPGSPGLNAPMLTRFSSTGGPGTGSPGLTRRQGPGAPTPASPGSGASLVIRSAAAAAAAAAPAAGSATSGGPTTPEAGSAVGQQGSRRHSIAVLQNAMASASSPAPPPLSRRGTQGDTPGAPRVVAYAQTPGVNGPVMVMLDPSMAGGRSKRISNGSLLEARPPSNNLAAFRTLADVRKREKEHAAAQRRDAGLTALDSARSRNISAADGETEATEMDATRNADAPQARGDPAKAEDDARTRHALDTLRFFMRRFVLFHQTRIQDEVRAVKSKCFEILFYICFVIVVLASSVIVNQDQDNYWFPRGILGQIQGNEFSEKHTHWRKTFDDIEIIEDVYMWMLSPFYNHLWVPSSSMWGQFEPVDSTNSSTLGPGLLFGMNRVVGGIVVGQLRSKYQSCDMQNDSVSDNREVFEWLDVTCVMANTDWSADSHESQDAAGVNGIYKWKGINETSLFTMKEIRDSTTPAVMLRSQTGRSYDIPAYPVILPNPADGNDSAARALDVINGLWRNRYMDALTRFVVVSFTVYNPNMDVFTLVEVSFEMTKSGSIAKSIDTISGRLYTPFESRTVNGLEVLVIIFYVYYLCIEILRTVSAGIGRLARFSTLMHQLNLVFFILYWAFKILAHVYTPNDVRATSSNYYDYRTPLVMRQIARLFSSINVFIVMFKLLAYLAIVPSFGIITSTLSRAAGPIASFAFITFLLMYAFSAAYMMSLGTRVFAFRNLASSSLSLMRALLGDFDFDGIQQGHWLLGPLLFILFVGLAVLVILNVIIALISRAYEDASANQDIQNDMRIARLFAQHAWSVTVSIPIIGPIIARLGDNYARKHKQWVESTSMDITGRPISRAIPLQPWERVQRRRAGRPGDPSATPKVVDVFTRALLASDTSDSSKRRGKQTAAGPANTTDPSGVQGGAQSYRADASSAAAGPPGTAHVPSRRASTSAGNVNEIFMVPMAETRRCCVRARSCLAEWTGVSFCLEADLAPVERVPSAMQRKARSLVVRGATVDHIGAESMDSFDPTRVSGPYATPLNREVMSRIALKKLVLGSDEYRKLVRLRLEQSVDAMVRTQWSQLAKQAALRAREEADEDNVSTFSAFARDGTIYYDQHGEPRWAATIRDDSGVQAVPILLLPREPSASAGGAPGSARGDAWPPGPASAGMAHLPPGWSISQGRGGGLMLPSDLRGSTSGIGARDTSDSPVRPTREMPPDPAPAAMPFVRRQQQIADSSRRLTALAAERTARADD